MVAEAQPSAQAFLCELLWVLSEDTCKEVRERRKRSKDKVSGIVLHQLDAQDHRKHCSVDTALKQEGRALIPAQ